MSKRLPLVALVSYPHFSPFHFGVPFFIFSAQLPEQALFDLKIVTPGGTALAAELFFWSRLLHAVVYIAGIAWIRTLAYAAGVVAMVMLFAAVVGGG